MGQQEVYDFLKEWHSKDKKRTKWFTSKEISEQLNISLGSITTSLKKLRQCKLVEYRNAGKRNMYEYRFKR